MWLRMLAEHYLRDAIQNAVVGEMKRRAAGEPGATADAAPKPPVEIAFLFALSVESGGLVDLLADVVRARAATFLEYDGVLPVEGTPGRRVIVVDTGAGRKSAAIAAEETIRLHKPRWLVSAGFAGGLVDSVRRGHLVLGDSIVGPGETDSPIELGWKFDPATLGAGVHVGPLATIDAIARTENEKRELARRTGAIACDMETHAVARVCREYGTRMLSARIISDAVEDELPPEIERLLGQKTIGGQIGAAVGAAMGRFSAIGDMWRLYEDSVKATRKLAKFLVAFSAGMT